MAGGSVANGTTTTGRKPLDPASGTAVILGAGTMGADIAAIFLAGGWKVEGVEPRQAAWPAVRDRVRESLRQLGAEDRTAMLQLHAGMETVAWAQAAVVVECAPERLDLKQQIFAELVGRAPAEIPLASNSSSFPISDIGRGLATRERMLGLHFFMPAHLVPAVEVIRSDATDPELAAQCAALMQRLGKVPVNVRKDVPGFLANRLQHALAREAFALIDEGFASPEDIDNAVRYGFGLRYLAAGPVLQKDIAGLDIHCAAAATMYPHLANHTAPARVLAEKVESGKLGMKSGEGFYRWTPESAARERARYERTLLRALQVLKEEEGG